jgi:Ni,Fe-hydrogenase III component G
MLCKKVSEFLSCDTMGKARVVLNEKRMSEKTTWLLFLEKDGRKSSSFQVDCCCDTCWACTKYDYFLSVIQVQTSFVVVRVVKPSESVVRLAS